MKNKIILLGIALLALLNSCSRNPVTGKKELSFMSESQELSLGKQSDPAIVAQYGLYENAALQSFINDKGKQMGAISHRPNLAYEFKILDSPIVNAFAVPGGYVYFTRGIMGFFNNEAEFAGVLGHEIGHIAAKHGARQQRDQILGQVLLMGGIIFSEKFRQFADVAQQGVGLLFLKNSRDHETESDKLGVEYSTKIGYDAREMSGFFNTLKKLGGDDGAIPTFLSTHPDPGDRFNKTGQWAAEIQKNMDVSKLKVNRNEYLRRIDGIIYGEDPKQGYVENGVFYHPELKFQFKVPDTWKLVNTPAQVQMAPADGKAMMLFGMAPGNNLQAAKNEVIKQYGLSVLESTNVNVNGLPAIALLSDVVQDNSAGSQTEAIKVLTYLIEYNQMIYVFHGVSSRTDFNTYFGQFQTTMKTFKSLSDASKINKKPTTIKIVEVPSSMSLQQLFNQFKMPAARHKELALLNSMELNTQLAKGTLVKVFGGEY
ncbi:MAG TPA: M48 family metalloprotease [Saprospiraceae bacterium]|jgi:predicted Zn-dependent protease|nr:M48 family metalloprotease [Saprospiraceae bacterium]HRO07324.1 M48 family metalloprotease [Saprospiraceae bacterium]HRP40607.1 M48 family metalloprotease [Saprospiraceae bacterium]